MARAKRASDETYNARRRYRRQAQRLLRKAESSTGATKARYESMARAATEKAAASYAKGQKAQGQVRNLMQKLGTTQPKEPMNADELKTFKERSYNALQKNQRALTKQKIASSILTGNVGSRFYAGLKPIWGKDAESRANPNKAILDYFKADNLLEVLQQIEQAGIDIYSPEDPEKDGYTNRALSLQNWVLSNRNTHER